MPDMYTMTVRDKSNWKVLESKKLFCRLYERFFEKTFNHALSYCREEQLAEDCVQDVFLKLWQNLQQIKVKVNDWRNWHFYLFVMTRNRAINLMKQRNGTILREAYSSFDSDVIYDDRILEKECNQIFIEAMSGLTRQQKRIFVLAYCSFKPRIIAKELALKGITVRNTLWSARKIMADYVEREFSINETLVKLANEDCD